MYFCFNVLFLQCTRYKKQIKVQILSNNNNNKRNVIWSNAKTLVLFLKMLSLWINVHLTIAFSRIKHQLDSSDTKLYSCTHESSMYRNEFAPNHNINAHWIDFSESTRKLFQITLFNMKDQYRGFYHRGSSCLGVTWVYAQQQAFGGSLGIIIMVFNTDTNTNT